MSDYKKATDWVKNHMGKDQHDPSCEPGMNFAWLFIVLLILLFAGYWFYRRAPKNPIPDPLYRKYV